MWQENKPGGVVQKLGKQDIGRWTGIYSQRCVLLRWPWTVYNRTTDHCGERGLLCAGESRSYESMPIRLGHFTDIERTSLRVFIGHREHRVPPRTSLAFRMTALSMYAEIPTHSSDAKPKSHLRHPPCLRSSRTTTAGKDPGKLSRGASVGT